MIIWKKLAKGREMKRKILVALVLTIFTVMAACGMIQGRRFQGEWSDINNPNHTALIERNGSSFLLTETRKGSFGELKEGPTPGTLKDGVLTFPVKLGSAPTAFIDSKTGHLIIQKAMGPLSSQTEFIKKKK
jgi:hypothetical protein